MRRTTHMLMAVALISVAGCGSPPAVTPLLRLADAAMRDEAQHIDTDIARLRASTDQSRCALDDAFAADLEQTAAPTKAWVLEAAQVYAAAREQLAMHQMQAEQAYAIRRANLLDASRAQRRAIALIERQDRLLTNTVGVDLWRLLPTDHTRKD